MEALAPYWAVYPALKAALFGPSGRGGYSSLRVEEKAVRATVFGHPEFTAYALEVHRAFEEWAARVSPALKDITVGDKPKAIIHETAEGLLAHFAARPLLDPYDLYQRLMHYWATTMQDDVYAIVADGWAAGREVEVSDGKKGAWEGRMLPRTLMARVYLAEEVAALEALEETRAAHARALEELTEEHGGEDGALAEVTTDKGKVAEAAVRARIKALTAGTKSGKTYALPAGTLALAAESVVPYGAAPLNAAEEPDELLILTEWARTADAEKAAAKAHAVAEAALADAVRRKYATLTNDEVKRLVVDEKWMHHLERAVHEEMDRISHRLAARVGELAARYRQPLAELQYRAGEAEDKVAAHLKTMGLSWN